VRRSKEKALLVQHEKLALKSGLVSERKIWKLARSERNPAGFKYRLALVDPKSHLVVLLYDNHWPKGPHVHWDDQERPYAFVSLEKLLLDFTQESTVEENRYHENKTNRD
jgi:hypothetical protein